MASYIKKGESILIPFRNGQSICDSQLKPRIYKTREAFEKHFPGHYLGKNGVELVEYAEVVRCKDCKHYGLEQEPCHGRTQRFCKLHKGLVVVDRDTFCSYGERRTDGR